MSQSCCVLRAACEWGGLFIMTLVSFVQGFQTSKVSQGGATQRWWAWKPPVSCTKQENPKNTVLDAACEWGSLFIMTLLSFVQRFQTSKVSQGQLRGDEGGNLLCPAQSRRAPQNPVPFNERGLQSRKTKRFPAQRIWQWQHCSLYWEILLLLWDTRRQFRVYSGWVQGVPQIQSLLGCCSSCAWASL